MIRQTIQVLRRGTYDRTYRTEKFQGDAWRSLDCIFGDQSWYRGAWDGYRFTSAGTAEMRVKMKFERSRDGFFVTVVCALSSIAVTALLAPFAFYERARGGRVDGVCAWFAFARPPVKMKL